MEEEFNFPRGGYEKEEEKKHTDNERKTKKRSNSRDFLFGQAHDEKSKKQKKSKDSAASASSKSAPAGISTLPLGGGGVLQPTQSSSLKKPAFIESLSFQKLAKGTKLLGIVREVAEEYAVVSLPGLLTGFLCKDKTGTPLTKVVSVGMCLPVIVVKATSETVKDNNSNTKQPIQKRRIELSVAPPLLNSGLNADMLFKGMHIRGRIRSVEDHGCLIDLGVSGLGGSTTFLKYENIEGKYEILDADTESDDDDDDQNSDVDFVLNEGRVFDFTIDSLPERADHESTRIVQVKLQTVEERAKFKVNAGKYLALNHTIRTLQPGMLVEADVEHHAKNGICVSFLGSVYRGSIDSSHLGGYLPDVSKDQKLKSQIPSDMWWKSVFTGKNRVVPARLIAVDPVTKIIRLSLLPHILNMNRPSENELPSVGTIIENARVVRMDAGVGALLALPTEDTSMDIDMEHDAISNLLTDDVYKAASNIKCAYVHISKAFDGKERTPDHVFAKKFALNHIIPKLRILSTSNWLDNVASCTTAENIVSSAILTHFDLQPGAIYKSVPILANLEGGGLLVQLSAMGVKGLVPSNQIFDKSSGNDDNSAYRKKVRMEKYKVGNKIDVRCLSVNSTEKKCILTAKRGLITSDTDDPITSYENIKSGRIATGFISKVSKNGLAVTFYNGVFGSVSARSLVDELGVEDPSLDYKVGDVIKVRVKECSKRSEDDEEDSSYFLNLSLDLTGDSSSDNIPDSQSNLISIMKSGTILPEKSMKVVELVPSKKGSTKDAVVPGYVIVSVKAKILLNDATASGSVNCKLPFDQVFDTYADDANTPDSLDAIVGNVLKVGKKIVQKGMVLSNLNSRTGQTIPVLTLKPALIETYEKEGGSNIIVPSPATPLYMGAYVQGYCARLDNRYGAFIRFFDNLTAIVPKLKGGLDIGLYDTVICKIVAMDVTTGKAPKILLKRVTSTKNSKSMDLSTPSLADEIHPGDEMGDVRVDSLNFARANVVFLDKKYQNSRVKARIHVTMANPISDTVYKMPLAREQVKKSVQETDQNDKITQYHPFHSWKVGSIIRNIKCVAVHVREGITYLELTNRSDDSSSGIPLFVEDPNHVKEGDIVSGVITAVSKRNQGVWVQICAGCSGFIPGLELSRDVDVLNNLQKYFKLGGRIQCRVLPHKVEKGQFTQIVRLSLLSNENESTAKKPTRGDIVVGRVNRNMKQTHSPALMIEFQGGFCGRCDITELEENDDWENMPLGRLDPNGSEVATEDDLEEEQRDQRLEGEYYHGLYVNCRVLSAGGTGPIEVSLRESRLEGDLDDDRVPEEKEIVHAYVVTTNKKGCFLRLSRFIEGRVILKELSDSFLPDPVSMFPSGRLVVGKVKQVRTSLDSKMKGKKSRTAVDLDLRESILLQDQNKLSFDDIKEGEKYNGVVTRIESYGVFVRIENSEISGLAHLSECSDDYIKNLSAMFDPGDLVKVMVIKVDKEGNKIGLSMKASHFEDDDSGSDSSSDSDSEEDGSQMDVRFVDSDVDSDDEGFASKIASKMQEMEAESDEGSIHKSSDDESSDGSDESDSSSESSSDDDDLKIPTLMDTDVGFDWDMNDSAKESRKDDTDSSSDESTSDSDESNTKKGHKSRKKAAAKRQEEKEIAKMEQRLADGTAEENPETVADFERLIASDPNASENWIKFMAYHLSLADIESARSVATRAFDRIEFREEGEKLNVWMALVTLESKYGTATSFSQAIENAAQHNNPKQVYLRVCEMLEKDVSSSHGDASVISKADEMFEKMCKKFRSKKTVWISHFRYLLKSGRHEEAHNLWKRSIKSLPEYKHVETMSKFAQLEYEHGSAERARTIFDALIDKHPKRMDLLFVYVDKEIKHGDVEHARKLFERTVHPPSGKKKSKFNDKQMKSLFKKWYRMEDENGDDESRIRVKMAAKEYVEKSTRSKA
jgi:rRNA biogenesis protein RRP5